MSSNNLQHIIGGKKHSGSSGRSLDVFNPATGKVTKTIEAASAKDTAKAIQVASDAFEDWSQVPPLNGLKSCLPIVSLLLSTPMNSQN